MGKKSDWERGGEICWSKLGPGCPYIDSATRKGAEFSQQTKRTRSLCDIAERAMSVDATTACGPGPCCT